MYSANSLFETPGISMSAAKPFVCCDLELDPIALFNFGHLYPELTVTGFPK